ncbi:L-threonine O-3-phosphate decarboxylase [Jatrophihabitans endophyticus]|uniref:Aminotransferase n=1 Tax=Jatrophihabitans endophyticus TaxID=1206085 RepID=A0A1M5Q764_9ACTN|nr:Rv2231c family pyridoxal phosphate-dependent protein CobC [Jatrophihabitans endophyticus]SHH09915.1 L-threonine O-3-phosphate decarboxylase [Jatrophihabitans endophyticus]
MTDVDLAHHGDRDTVPGLVDLAVNVRAGGPPAWLGERIAQADVVAYPDQTAALAAVAARHGRPPREVLLTAGAAEAFVLLARALRPRHAVVVHPQFTEPEAALHAAGHRVERLLLAPPFGFDPAAVPADADLVVVGNPTNPTSVLHPAGALRALLRPGRTVVVDEAFADAVPGEPESLAGESHPGLVVVRSLTKTWGIAGLRAGYVLAGHETVDRLRDVQPAWPVSAPALAAAAACSLPAAVVEAEAWAAALGAVRDDLVTRLGAIPDVRVVPAPAASFVLVETPCDDVRTRLLRRGFAVRRGETFPGLGARWVRIAVRDTATSTALADALRAALAEAPA